MNNKVSEVNVNIPLRVNNDGKTGIILRYFSDLHLEFLTLKELEDFIQKIPLPKENEVCILAGDIGYPQNIHYDIFMKFISNHFTKSFVITGNHEYYHKTQTIEEINLFLQNYFSQFENISFLNNSIEIYNNICFIGSVLWSNITEPKYTINDLNKVKGLTVEKYNQIHNDCVEFLTNAINTNTNCVVITHHVPSYSLIDKKYKNSTLLPYNQWFYSNMEPLFVSNVKAWIYGHTHCSSIKMINNIPFLCNPMGYPYENNNYDYNAHIILSV